MAINTSILTEINSTNFEAITTLYNPAVGNSGYVTTLKLTVNIKSIAAANFPYIPDETPPDVLEKILENVANATQFKEIQLLLKKGAGAWIEKSIIRLFNKEPYYEINLLPYLTDANTIDVAEDLSIGIRGKLGATISPGDKIICFGTAVEEKKNDPQLVALSDRIQVLENLFGFMGSPTAFRQKQLVGIAGAAGSSTVVPHGVSSDKIVGVSSIAGIADSGRAAIGPYPTSLYPGFDFGWWYDATNIYFDLSATNSTYLFELPFAFLITYLPD